MKPTDYLRLLIPVERAHDPKVRARYRMILRRLVRQVVVIAYATIQHSHDSNHVHRESHRIAREVIP